MKKIAIITTALLIFLTARSQKKWQDFFDERYTSLCSSTSTFRETYLLKSTTGNLYDFIELSSVADALMNMYVSTGDEKYLNDEIKIINNILSSARVSKSIPGNTYKLKDDYLGWISKTPNYAYNNETELYEGYIFRYITQFLYEIRKSGWKDRSSENTAWYDATLQFIEKNSWEKWIDRSLRSKATPYGTFVGTRAHMAAHWAYIGLVLKELTNNTTIKNQCQDVVDMYDLLLQRNLKPNLNFPNAYIWNSNWDDVAGTQAQLSPPPSVQDVSHGNHVIAYIAIARQFNNPDWSDDRIARFCNTVKQGIYEKNAITFSDNVDGSSSSSRPGWGNFQADGWVKLGHFDQQVRNIYNNYAVQQEKLVTSYGQGLQYYSNLALIEYYLNK